MIQHQRLRTSDVDQMLALSNEVGDLPDEMMVRAEHLLRGMCRLVRAQVGIFSLLEGYLPNGQWRIRPMIDFGWAGDAERRWNMSFFEGPQLDDPLTPPCIALPGKVTTAMRQHLVSDPDWYSSPNVNELRRNARVDHCIYSCFRINENGDALGIALHRPWGDRPFSERDVAIVDLLHRNQTIRRTTREVPPAIQLAPRESEVLSLFKQGLSEKEAAGRLGISRHTVHVYVKSLYRKLGVNSRAELMSLWIAEKPQG